MNVLLVEDDAGIAHFIRAGLSRENISTSWVRSIGEAEQRVRDTDPDAMILDRRLPDGDGAAWCRTLRQQGLVLPIIMLTARDTLADKLEGFDCGADDYVTKPFSFAELLARMRVHLRKGSASAEPGLALDQGRRSLASGGREVLLTMREFALMDLLMRRREKIVTRAQVFAAAWPEQTGASDNLVDVYIGYLRRKLAQIDADHEIQTVRSSGFILSRTH